jgi:hypothetical protein
MNVPQQGALHHAGISSHCVGLFFFRAALNFMEGSPKCLLLGTD